MKLIVGLGNPGAEYAGTRHNFGFAVLDYLAQQWNASSWSNEAKFSGVIATASIGGEKVILLKPTTYYNLVGNAIQKIKQFYKLDNTDILVVHDEMALPLGTIRTRKNGSDAGNNGIKNIIATISSNFARIRIGSGQTPTHDGDTQPTHDRRDYVLCRLNQFDQSLFESGLPVVKKLVEDFIAGKFTVTTMEISNTRALDNK